MPHRLAIALAVLACAPLPACGGAGPAPRPSLDELLDGVMLPAIGDDPADLARCPGAVVAAITPVGAIVRGYGTLATADAADRLLQVGSISKLYTALGFARLVARGELSATDLARAHFADDLAAALAPATFTLADLATHHAGLPDMPANLVDRDGDGTRDPGADPLSPAAGYARLDLAHALAADPPGAAAGYRYSNLGVGLLGLALADQLGTASHHAVLRALVADALGMSDTWGQVAALDAAAIARVAPGLAVNGGRRVAGRLAQMGVLAGAGEVVTSGDDLVHLLAALTGNVTSALDDAIELALASHATGPSAAIDLGYAFEIERLPDGARYTKGGATASYTAYLAFRRTPAEGAVILSPCGGFSAVRDLALALDEQLAARSR